MVSYFQNQNKSFLKRTALWGITVLCCLTGGFTATGQEVQLLPAEEIVENEDFTKIVLESEEREKANLTGYTKKQLGLIEEQIGYRTTLLNSLLESGELMLGSPLQTYVEKVFQRIVEANPAVGKNYHIYASRSSIPNAFSVGGGFIIVNVGLLTRLDSEAELVFVLSHELSHQVLDHSNQVIVENAIAATDPARREQVKKILRSHYRVHTQLENLILPGLTKQMGFRRSMELQADSLGLVYYLRTMYPARGALDAMLLLDKIDVEGDTSLIDLKGFFVHDSVLFKPGWLRYNTASSLAGVTGQPDTLAEALRTHPDALYRLEILRQIVGTTGRDTSFAGVDTTFEAIRRQSMIDNIHGLFLNGNYSGAIYTAMRTIQRYPGQSYPRHVLSVMMARLSILRVERRAGEFLDLTNREYSEAYNRLITFLWEVGSKDCALLSYWIVRPAAEEKDRIALEAMLYSAMAMGRKKEFRPLFSEYKRRFPESIQAQEFEDYLNAE